MVGKSYQTYALLEQPNAETACNRAWGCTTHCSGTCLFADPAATRANDARIFHIFTERQFGKLLSEAASINAPKNHVKLRMLICEVRNQRIKTEWKFLAIFRCGNRPVPSLQISRELRMQYRRTNIISSMMHTKQAWALYLGYSMVHIVAREKIRDFDACRNLFVSVRFMLMAFQADQCWPSNQFQTPASNLHRHHHVNTITYFPTWPAIPHNRRFLRV